MHKGLEYGVVAPFRSAECIAEVQMDILYFFKSGSMEFKGGTRNFGKGRLSVVRLVEFLLYRQAVAFSDRLHYPAELVVGAGNAVGRPEVP